MVSLRDVMADVGIDTSGAVSVLRNFFGFQRARVPTDPDNTVTASVRVLTQIGRVRQRHLHLNVIEVGLDTLTATDRDRRQERIDYAIYRTQNVYAGVNLGIGRVLYYNITDAGSDGLADIGSEDEADELVERATVENDGVDCFVVRTISGGFTGMAAAIPGSCDKGSKTDGLVAGASDRGDEGFAKTFAHELGHHLGLSHPHGDDDCPTTTAGQNNLMSQSRCAAAGGEAGWRAAVLLTSAQGATMRGHCSTHDGI